MNLKNICFFWYYIHIKTHVNRNFRTSTFLLFLVFRWTLRPRSLILFDPSNNKNKNNTLNNNNSCNNNFKYCIGRIPWMAQTDLKVQSIFPIFLSKKNSFRSNTDTPNSRTQYMVPSIIKSRVLPCQTRTWQFNWQMYVTVECAYCKVWTMSDYQQIIVYLKITVRWIDLSSLNSAVAWLLTWNSRGDDRAIFRVGVFLSMTFHCKILNMPWYFDRT
jgi:hypothetical protein